MYELEHSYLRVMFGNDVAVVNTMIANFQDELVAFAYTEDVPTPTTHYIIEEIVRNHDGKYVVVNTPSLDISPTS